MTTYGGLEVGIAARTLSHGTVEVSGQLHAPVDFIAMFITNVERGMRK